MPLADDIEEFRRNVTTVIEELEEVRDISDKLTECAVDDMQRYLNHLQDLCEQVSIEIKRATDQLIEINTKWGSNRLKKISNVRTDRVNLDIQRSLINANSFFVNAVKLGLPTKLALYLAAIPGDSYIIRNLITSQSKLSGTASQENPEAALQLLSRIWTTVALGDQGELSTWKTLIESGILPENILVKPHLINHFGEKACPDFYCESEQLICDSKAWKEIHSLQNVQQVVNKYVTFLKEDGELRLYFPSDTYESCLTRLNQLTSPNPSVKVTFYRLTETYKDLELRKQFFYNYVKSYKR